MKIYRVKVNGKVYEVELEALTESNKTIEVPAAKEEKAVETNTTSAPASGDKTLVAPISGKVLDVKVKVGDTIKKHQVVALIEAMKLENEVPATTGGVVKEIKISKGSDVTSGDVLIVLG